MEDLIHYPQKIVSVKQQKPDIKIENENSPIIKEEPTEVESKHNTRRSHEKHEETLHDQLCVLQELHRRSMCIACEFPERKTLEHTIRSLASFEKIDNILKHRNDLNFTIHTKELFQIADDLENTPSHLTIRFAVDEFTRFVTEIRNWMDRVKELAGFTRCKFSELNIAMKTHTDRFPALVCEEKKLLEELIESARKILEKARKLIRSQSRSSVIIKFFTEKQRVCPWIDAPQIERLSNELERIDAWERKFAEAKDNKAPVSVFKQLAAQLRGSNPVLVETRVIREIDEFTALFCLCQQPSYLTIKSELMIECDSCSDWFHNGCVGISNDQTGYVLGKFCCPRCCNRKGIPYLFGSCVPDRKEPPTKTVEPNVELPVIAPRKISLVRTSRECLSPTPRMCCFLLTFLHDLGVSNSLKKKIWEELNRIINEDLSEELESRIRDILSDILEKSPFKQRVLNDLHSFFEEATKPRDVSYLHPDLSLEEPRKPKSAYKFYIDAFKSNTHLVAQELALFNQHELEMHKAMLAEGAPDTTVKVWRSLPSKIIAEKWKNLSKESREPFFELSRQSKEQYDKDLAAFEDEKIRHPFVLDHPVYLARHVSESEVLEMDDDLYYQTGFDDIPPEELLKAKEKIKSEAKSKKRQLPLSEINIHPKTKKNCIVACNGKRVYSIVSNQTSKLILHRLAEE